MAGWKRLEVRVKSVAFFELKTKNKVHIVHNIHIRILNVNV